jgi:DNA-binding PadR family transcriptional regulator
MRYSQIFKLVEGVSQRMLTLTLKSLERDGLVTRTVYPTNPPRVDYELTERGKTLICALTLALDVGSGQPHLHSRVPAATSINSAARMGHLPDWRDARFTQIGRFPSSTGPHEASGPLGAAEAAICHN